MGLLGLKYTEEEMYDALRGGLLPGEEIIAAVYASFQERGFWSSASNVQAGYLGLTDSGRLIGVRYSLLQTMPFSALLGAEKRLKVKKGLFGSRTVDLDTGQVKLRITATPKLGAGTQKLPHQAEHFQTIMAALEAQQAAY